MICASSKASYSKCHDADLFLDYCSKISEVTYRVKNPCFRMHRVYVINQKDTLDITDFRHTILKLTLNNGEQHALDLTGAQYGWTETIMPWAPYAKSRV